MKSDKFKWSVKPNVSRVAISENRHGEQGFSQYGYICPQFE